MATIEAVARMRDELSGKLEKIYALTKQTESGVEGLEHSLTDLGNNDGLTKLATKATVDLAIVNAALKATELQALKTAAALDLVGASNVASAAPAVGAAAASGLILPPGVRSPAAAAGAAAAASAATTAATTTSQPSITSGGSQPNITRDMMALRQWDYANPSFFAASPGFFGSRSGAYSPGMPSAGTTAAQEAWQRIAAGRAPPETSSIQDALTASQASDRRLEAFLADMAAKGRTGSELGPGEYASKNPLMHGYYRYHGYEPAMAPDDTLRLYGVGGEPGSSNFGIVPGTSAGGGGARGPGGPGFMSGFFSGGGGRSHGRIGFSPFGGLYFRRGGGGGGGDEGIGRKLLWGGGGLFGIGAGAGSLGSFAGLGAEHLLLTAGGIVGSGIGALAGGGLLAAGAGGRIAVGGGSDLAIMKSTIADTKTLGESWNKVSEAVEKYGRGSKQAREATKAMREEMQELAGKSTGRGVRAELGLAKKAANLGEFFDTKSQGARVSAVHLLEQGLPLGRTFIPLVSHAAEQNLSIIDKNIKPLFHWLEGPHGVGIFENLEHHFKQNLPTSVHAFDEAVKFALKTLNLMQKYGGGLAEDLDKIFTYANSPKGWKSWEHTVESLVKDFEAWKNLLKELGRDLYDLFSQDAHTGRGIVEELTEMLAKLGEWERSTQGKHQIRNIFLVHREEIEQILHLLPPLLTGFGKIYLVVAPPLVKALTEVAGALVSVLEALNKVPGGPWLIGLTLIANHIGVLMPMLKGFRSVLAGTVGESLLSGVAAGGAIGSTEAAAAGSLARMPTALGALPLEGAPYATALAAGGIPGVLATGANRIGAPIVRGLGIGATGYFAGGLAGQLIGGQAGSIVGSAISGAGIGAGIGSMIEPGVGTALGGLAGGVIGGIGGLFSEHHAPHISKADARWNTTMHAVHRFEQTLNQLRRTEKEVARDKQRHKRATQEVAQAQEHLNNVIAKFGPNAVPTIKAQQALATAQHRAAVTAREEKEAMQLHGIELQSARIGLKSNIGQQAQEYAYAREQQAKALFHYREIKANPQFYGKGPQLRAVHELEQASHRASTLRGDIAKELQRAGRVGGQKLEKELFAMHPFSHVVSEFTKEVEHLPYKIIARHMQEHGIKEMEAAGEKQAAAYARKFLEEGKEKGAEASKGAVHAVLHGNSPGGLESDESLAMLKGAGESGAQQYAQGLHSQMSKIANVGKAIVNTFFAALESPSHPGHSGTGGPPGTPSGASHGKGGMSAGFLAGQEMGHELARGAAADLHALRRKGASMGKPGSRFSGAFSHGRFTFPLPQGSWTAGSVDQGWDLSAAGGTPLLAVGAGTIVGHGISGFGPWAPILKLDSGQEVYYGHAGPGRELKTGTHVRAGQVIGEVGKGIVGMSTGPHLEIGFYPPGPMGAGGKMKSALGYAGGGRVPGMREARDSVPGMLSPEEFVVTGSGEKILERMTHTPRVLDQLEHMQGRHFAGGGRAIPTVKPATVASPAQSLTIQFNGDFHLGDRKQMKEFADELVKAFEHHLMNSPSNASEPTFAG